MTLNLRGYCFIKLDLKTLATFEQRNFYKNGEIGIFSPPERKTIQTKVNGARKFYTSRRR